jgi:hypothetical protein
MDASFQPDSDDFFGGLSTNRQHIRRIWQDSAVSTLYYEAFGIV